MAGSQRSPTPEGLDALVAALDTLSASIEQRAKNSPESVAAPELTRAEVAVEKASEAIARLLSAPKSERDAATDLLRNAVQAVNEASLAVEQLAAANPSAPS
jgi:hypothetical protein